MADRHPICETDGCELLIPRRRAPEWRKVEDGCGTPHAIHVTRTELEQEQPLTFWTMHQGEFYECRVYLGPVEATDRG